MHAPRPLAPTGAFVIGAICYLAVVVSHQLSPIMILVAVWTFAVLTRRLPLWIPLAMTAVEVYWVTLAWPFVSRHNSLLNPNPGAGHPKVHDPSHALPGLELVRYGSWLLTLVLVVAAATGLVRRFRERHFDVLPVAFAAGPVLVFFLQSYGGEAVFRTYLFALPWLAFLAAAACMPSPMSRVPLAVRRRFVVLAAIATPSLLFAYFGYEKANYFSRSDVAAARWWEQHAPHDSALGLIAQNFPSRLDGRYAYAQFSEAEPTLTDEGGVRYRPVRPSDLRRIIHMFDYVGGRNRYLAITPSQERYSDLWGLLPRGSFTRLRYLLAHSRHFRIVYSNGQSEIYKVVQPQ